MTDIATTLLAFSLAIALFAGTARSQNWQYDEYGNPIDGDYQVQSVISADDSDELVLLLITNNTRNHSWLVALAHEVGFCSPEYSYEIDAIAVFDKGNAYNLTLTFQDNPGGSILHFPYERKWVNLISESQNLYMRLFLCANHVDLEFDISGPVKIPRRR